MFEKKKISTMATLFEAFTRKAKEISKNSKEEAVRQRTVADNANEKAAAAEVEAALADNFIANFEALAATKAAE